MQERENQKREDNPRQMLETSQNTVFFPWFVCPVSRKVGSVKRRVRRYVVRGEIENCTPLWRGTRLVEQIARRCGEKHIWK